MPLASPSRIKMDSRSSSGAGNQTVLPGRCCRLHTGPSSTAAATGALPATSMSWARRVCAGSPRSRCRRRGQWNGRQSRCRRLEWHCEGFCRVDRVDAGRVSGCSSIRAWPQHGLDRRPAGHGAVFRWARRGDLDWIVGHPRRYRRDHRRRRAVNRSRGQGRPLDAACTDVRVSFNDPFDGSTGFEWLSRDQDEVQKYVDDPWSGSFAFSNGFVLDFFNAMADIWRPEHEALIPTSLPVLIASGEKDPAGGFTTTAQVLIDRYRALGLEDLTVKFYQDARHEILNEVNRDEVQADLYEWMAARIG